MGLKYYLNLFKKETNNEAVKLRYFFNIFTFIVYLVFAAVFFSLRSSNVVVSSVFGMLAILMAVVYHILNKSFQKLIERLIVEEELSENDEIDAAFIAYRKGYREFNEKTKKQNKIFSLLGIIPLVAFVGFFPATIILNLSGKIDLALKVSLVARVLMIAFIALLFIISIFTGREGLWYQSYTDELIIINKYKSASSGESIKFKITEDKKQDKQFEYILPDEKLRKKHKALQGAIIITTAAFFVLFVASIITLTSILGNFGLSEDTIGSIIAGVIAGFFAIFITALILINAAQNKIIKKQYLLFKQDEERFSNHIKLHELRVPFMKRWNILFLVCFLAEIISNIIFAGVLSVIAKTDSYGFIFFVLFLIEFIATFVIYFKSYGKVRLKMILIENEIDKAVF